jgi:hypothetical protein
MEQKDYLSYSFFLDTDTNLTEGFTDTDFPKLASIVTRSNDISHNVWKLYNDLSNNIHNENPNDILDLSGNFKNTKTVVDVAREDAQYLLIQQNSLYMVGTITIATLLITAILISK